jgi:spermidine dehydrogenase
MNKRSKLSTKQEYLLGMDQGITRRDFLNAVLIGSGAVLLTLPAPRYLMAQVNSWDGYGGIGDYAESHGNSKEIIRLFQEIQKGKYNSISSNITDTQEIFDLVIIGGGLSGLGAAYEFKKKAKNKQKCLILENHSVFGGQAKRNEFNVNGHKLIGPQASNSFVVINSPGVPGYDIFSELEVPGKFEYQKLSPDLKQLQFDRTNYGFALWHDISPNVGYFFEDQSTNGKARWIRDLWAKEMEGSPYSEKERQDFLIWRNKKKRYYRGTDFKHWLDSMTYKDYIEKVMGLSPEITSFADPILASGLGLGCDVISAYGAYQISMPGFQGFTRRERNRRLEESNWQSFPGGNDGFSRYMLKELIPDSIYGKKTFQDILNNRINFTALDKPRRNIRIRLGSTVVRVEHNSDSDRSQYVSITYIKNGVLYNLKAESVVMASGGGINRKIVRDLPEEYQSAYRKFYYSSVMVVNVALTNWRFLYKLGLTGCRWFKGFGYSCNMRQPMIIGDYKPPLRPDKPIILTFYVPFHYPGLPIHEQGELGRKEIFSTSYYEYERLIREQMVRLFSRAGFNPRKDIAGIILNRWAYAYLNPEPGFYFGRNGQSTPRDIIRNRFGRIAFGHSELDGHQNWSGAIHEGRRAAKQAFEVL